MTQYIFITVLRCEIPGCEEDVRVVQETGRYANKLAVQRKALDQGWHKTTRARMGWTRTDGQLRGREEVFICPSCKELADQIKDR